ncbi:FAD-dependent monooxygenase [Paracidobacterium acidisoli]|uniref:FAD-dependent oxidoreductase n=1 Tax=Paracidobacterium acidisoli TaxID=2303751 RepID=A0A372IUJ6_9BACT|nr:FAD-dependent monooxygenase [Paracidobacterium acidisoli]
MKNGNILISGASVAGPALAFWLHRYGFQPTIVERAPAVRPGGYAIDFRGASLRVLERMGLLPEVQRKQTRIGAITIVDRNNSKVASMPDGFTSGELEILRGDLADIFHEATRETTEYIFDDSIAAMEESEDGVDVLFQSGRRRRFDLVAGADGLHSKVRSVAFGEEADFVRYLGYYVSIFTIPNYLHLDHAGLYYGTPGRKVGIFSGGDPAEAKASFFFATEPLCCARYDSAQQKEILRSHFGREGWEVPRLLEWMESAPDFYFDSVSQVKMKRWSAGRCVLLGDAAYCASPLSGMGTGMAVVGAYVLAGELAESGGNHRVAFESYERLMRRFVEKCQGIADGGVDWFVPRTRFRLWLSHQMWKILPYTPWKNMMIEVPLKIGNSIDLRDYEGRTGVC